MHLQHPPVSTYNTQGLRVTLTRPLKVYGKWLIFRPFLSEKTLDIWILEYIICSPLQTTLITIQSILSPPGRDGQKRGITVCFRCFCLWTANLSHRWTSQRETLHVLPGRPRKIFNPKSSCYSATMRQNWAKQVLGDIYNTDFLVIWSMSWPTVCVTFSIQIGHDSKDAYDFCRSGTFCYQMGTSSLCHFTNSKFHSIPTWFVAFILSSQL